ncbi:hypothetical protein [Clostridium sp. C2-6-12]|uniref:hypothetical protein n=1 Tax=Clostridium sp. C2-6-12 TaxID=2698832 RepID=UPI00136EFF73|nr:hypothetical protein [Clostridium sp. C2-6-12]
MKTSQLFQLIFGTVINCCILGRIIFIVSTKLNITLEDTSYIIGLMTLFIGISFNILGNSARLSMENSEDLKSQYISKSDLKNYKYRKKKDVFSNSSIISGVIIISSIVILIAGHFL